MRIEFWKKAVFESIWPILKKHIWQHFEIQMTGAKKNQPKLVKIDQRGSSSSKEVGEIKQNLHFAHKYWQ